ncbi:SapC family protein [Methylobacterium sp. Leaf99]|uniref:SapC family protein n=1 Tax=Methylobacterium sp. Leaf99 TaxID=1736251 RepID=UPI0009EB07A7|nr:SapC family protein [Methylobacterium sp. Leaf99]
MSSIQPISRARHAGLRWNRNDSYNFSSGRNLVALAAAELLRAALSLPMTFVEQGGQWSLCALLGLAPGQNLYVGPDGRWIGSYIPATLRAHPFHLGWEGVNATLSLDEDSGLLFDDGSGEPIFDTSGDLSEPVRKVWSFLSATAESLLALEAACRVLAEVGVVVPWPITLQGTDGTHTVSGLFQIDEAALNALDDEAFGRLRRAGVLGVAYAQLLSMGNLADLGKLAQARAEFEAAERARAEVKPMMTLPDDSTIDWDWSKVGKT